MQLSAKIMLNNRFADPLLRILHRTMLAFVLLPAATKLGQGYVFTGVCDSVNGGGFCLSACWDTPLDREPPLDGDPP